MYVPVRAPFLLQSRDQYIYKALKISDIYHKEYFIFTHLILILF